VIDETPKQALAQIYKSFLFRNLIDGAKQTLRVRQLISDRRIVLVLS
jgi:hypothetical protein